MNTRTIRIACIAATIAVLASTYAVADQPKVLNPGIHPKATELFTRDWTPIAIDQPEVSKKQLREIATTRGRFDTVQFAKDYPGDGLGPMHNATSCVACHAVGGSSGVDRNVIMLTLDPRSPILEALTVSADAKDESIEGNRRAAVEKLREFYPGLIGLLGELSVDIVIHEQSTDDNTKFQAMRQSVFTSAKDANPRGLDRTKRASEAIAAQPVIAGRSGKIDFYLSQRNAPPLYGLRYLDQVDQGTISSVASRQFHKTKGEISGRVPAGRFGWRGQSPDLESFVRNACAGELGLQVSKTAQLPSATNPDRLNFGNDISDKEVLLLTSFIRGLKTPFGPATRGHMSKKFASGQAVFNQVGCVHCHVKDLTPARNVYSDLLLHDMGEQLQAPSPAPTRFRGGRRNTKQLISINSDFRRFASLLLGTPRGAGVPSIDSNDDLFRSRSRRFVATSLRGSSISYYGMGNGTSIPTPYSMARPAEPQFPYGEIPADEYANLTKQDAHASPFGTGGENDLWDVLQREWRTPPLWGVADSAPYLHDGRAKTLHEAILWHGGESESVIQKYRDLEVEDRALLLQFLRSLRAPHMPREIAKAKQPLKSVPPALLVDNVVPVGNAGVQEDGLQEPDGPASEESIFSAFADGY